MSTELNKRPRGTRWCKIGIFLAIIAAIATVVGLGGGRTGLLPGITAFMAFGLGCLLFMVSIVLNLIGLAISKGTAGDASAGRALTALTVGIIVVGAGISQAAGSSGVPPIHDLTTDVVNPPAFIAVVPLRAGAQNPPEYLDNGSAEQQLAAYPDLETLKIDQPTAAVFSAAEQVVTDMGWQLVAADPATGRIEATDTTYWFSFKDDVVIRIEADPTGTVVDVRSKSRVGMSDMGANARRIHTFLAALTETTGT